MTALDGGARGWRHGYDLGQETGLRAGSLYPILMRLADRGFVEAAWEADPPLGRPRRHLYRILDGGRQLLDTDDEMAGLAGAGLAGVGRVHRTGVRRVVRPV